LNALLTRTWYDDTAIEPVGLTDARDLPQHKFDVAIIGGGLAGLVALLELSKAGAKVVLLEANQIGSGASGRNGGFCSAGWASTNKNMSALLGTDRANILNQLGYDGFVWTRNKLLSPDYSSSMPIKGELRLSLWNDSSDDLSTRKISREYLRKILTAKRYKTGFYNSNAFHFHPLNFIRTLTKEAIDAGGTVVENFRVKSVTKRHLTHILETHSVPNTIYADKVIFATGGYGGKEFKFGMRHQLPIKTYIGVSEPMHEILNKHITRNWAYSDTRRAGNYYRKLQDGSLLWGTSITAYGTLNTEKIKKMILNDITSVFGELGNEMTKSSLKIKYAWAGNMAYARHFLPYVKELQDGQYILSGFGGHGMNTAPIAAQLLSHAIITNSNAIQPFKDIPNQRVYGKIGLVGAELRYLTMQFLDFYKELKSK